MTASPAPSPGSTVMEAKTVYALQPPIELAIEFSPVHPDRHLPDLAPAEFVTDGLDDLRMVVYARHRGSNDPPSAAIRNVAITRVELGGDRHRDFVLREDTAYAADPANAGTRAFRLSTVDRHGLLATAERLEAHTIVTVEARGVPKQGGARGWIDRTEFPLRPLYPCLRLWVVGGEKKGTSVAGVFACLPQKERTPLAGLPLQLWTESNGAASLTIASGETATDGKGLCRWTLKYAGLTWDTLAGTRLRVCCGIAGDTGRQPTEWTRFDILPYDNVVDLLKEIIARRVELRIDNPGFQPQGNYLWPSAAPTILRGPAYNLAHPRDLAAMVHLASDPPESYGPYLCKHISSRLHGMMTLRRFGGAASGRADPASDEAMTRMNGIEISAWDIPAHVWTGIHLSGSEPNDDPRYIDPWWHQEWSADNISPARLTTKYQQTQNAVAVSALAAVLAVAACYVFAAVATAVSVPIARVVGKRFITRPIRWFAKEALLTWRAGARARVVGASVTVATATGGTASAFFTSVVDPSCVDGHYRSYRDAWLENRAVHLAKTPDTLVTEPFCQRR